MLSVAPLAVLDGTQTTNQFTWSFDSAPSANDSAESFDYLANGETLTLTYTLTLLDSSGRTEFTTLSSISLAPMTIPPSPQVMSQAKSQKPAP